MNSLRDHNADDRLWGLVADLCDGSIGSSDFADLESRLREDEAARLFFAAYTDLHGRLLWRFRSGAQDARPGPQELDFSELPLAPPSSLSTTHYPLPTAFVGGPVFSYMVATVVLCLMLLGAWAYKINHDSNLALDNSRNSTPSGPAELVFVGKITGMKECRWSDTGTPTVPGASVSLNREYALASGLLEITYKSGARVILEGPCTYKVDSDAGGYLAVGKLTARIDSAKPQAANSDSRNSSLSPHSSSFVVTTPTAIVTDLGTEFGVEVDEDGGSEIHLIEGRVSARRLDADGTSSKSIELKPGQAVLFASDQTAPVMFDAAVKRFTSMRDKLIPNRKLSWPIADKTFVAWVSLANLDQQGGGVIAIEQPDTHEFDGIAFAELASRKWWAASNNYARSPKDLSNSAEETAGPEQLIQIAIVYKWNRITIFRNGKVYANYNTDGKQSFDEGSFILMGKRCVDRDWLDPPALSPPLTGMIEEARLYDTALGEGTIASLKPGESSPIAPVGHWTFEDDTARDATGNFPPGELRGGAIIAGGKLILDGRGGYLVVPTAKANDRKEASE